MYCMHGLCTGILAKSKLIELEISLLLVPESNYSGYIATVHLKCFVVVFERCLFC